MTMIADLLQLVIGMAVGWRTLLVVNQMTVHTHDGLRFLYVTLGVMAAWIAVAPLFPDYPADMAKLIAIAAYLGIELVNRRSKKE